MAHTDSPYVPALTLRPLAEADNGLLERWASDPDTVRWTDLPASPPVHERHWLWLALEDGAPVGVVEVDCDDEVGWALVVVAPEHRRRGIGTALLKQLVRQRELLGLVLTGEAEEANVASLAMLRRAGWAETGPGLSEGFRRFEAPQTETGTAP